MVNAGDLIHIQDTSGQIHIVASTYLSLGLLISVPEIRKQQRIHFGKTMAFLNPKSIRDTCKLQSQLKCYYYYYFVVYM